MKSKLLILILSITLGTRALFAESGMCGGNLTWTFENGVLTISGTGEMKDFDREDINYYSMPWWENIDSIYKIIIANGVTSIGDLAFSKCSSLTSITIPNSITRIGSGAFDGCSSLTSIEIPHGVTSIEGGVFSDCSSLTYINIPNSVTSIGYDAFNNCDGLTYIEIPHSVTSIGESAFSDCDNLTSVTIPNSVTSIDKTAFAYSGLTSIIIPSSVASIGSSAFVGCSNLTSINVAVTHPSLCSVDGVLFNKTKTTLIQYPAGQSKTYYTIPSSVTSIGDYAFHYCKNLISVTIPNSVTTIGKEAFSVCKNLKSITIPNSVTSIGEAAFGGCNNLISINVAVTHPSLCSVDGVLFNKTETTLIQYPAGKQGIRYNIPYGVTSIGNYAFCRCEFLTSITIPNSVTSIGRSAFSGCYGLASITIPNSVTSIGEAAFFGCYGLASITIPNSVTSIGNYAFSGCENLKEIHYPAGLDLSYKGILPSLTKRIAYSTLNSKPLSEFELILQKAQQGDAEAQYAVGEDYYYGNNDEQDYSEAIYWYRKAAEQSNANAQSAMGYMYVNGYGVEKNYSIAMIWYKKAAEGGNSYAQKGYDELYESGYREAGADLKNNDNLLVNNSDMSTDVDHNIPVTNTRNNNTFVLIIANENYDSPTEPVPFAINDGKIFREYCIKTLGISDKQILYYEDATLGKIRRGVKWLAEAAEIFDNPHIIVYYAGHGVPDEAGKSSYLLPTDGVDASTGYKLDNLYATLGKMPASRITVFMDACFSGSKREEGMLASSRGVALKAKAGVPQGKMVVFSAAQGDETAYPNKEQQHGLFTYFLLKKLKETKGDITLKDLGDYVTKQVRQQSFLLNSKRQNPCVTPSAEVAQEWETWKLK